ncbi:MAG: ABC transporter transmembrane domain-containing protein, partial [Rhodospirillales bacterium]|nr:ABC transporter transmembrane domain-containing protein [Rhodospirillales bacterium]
MIVLDKVVNYQSQSTLYVIAGGVLVAYIFNGIFGYLRQYLILFATSKVDVRVNGQVFSKLLDLPLSFFQERSISDLVKTVQQTNTLRQVLTGKFFAAILDSTALVIFIPILFMYSPLLCAVVFVFAILISANVAIASRVQKDKMKSAAAADSEKQLVLMNSVSGIETVKSLALEPVQKHEWQDAAAHQIIANLELGKANAVTSQISATLQQMMTVAVIFIGVQLVFSGELSAGVLIGANMLAGRITGPLVQLVSLAIDMEKVSIAVKTLASVMNTRGESGRRGLVPDILGGIEFKDVSFTYEDGTKALDGVTFNILPRQKIGLVGRSGAGKTTIARHIQGTLRPDEGMITVDGEDLRSVDIGHFRMNVAVVNQDACLFKGSIRSNILKPSPGSTMAQVLWASKMVGLH